MRLLKGLYLILLGGVGYVVSTVSAASLQDTMIGWEQRTQMNQGLIANGALIDTALATLNRSCSMDTTMLGMINQNVQGLLIDIGLTLTKDTAAQYYTMYQQWHEAAVTYRDIDIYCVYKIVAYQLQQRFYLVYKGRAEAVNPVRSNYSYLISIIKRNYL